MKTIFFLALGSSLSLVALADDGWVGNGGTPSTMGGKHPAIRMADETVTVHVGRERTTVDCLFHFVNDGDATTVKMGFPDYDSNREEASQGTVFKKYESWVDGKKTPCKFEGSNDDGFWQTKMVSFGAKQKRTVRDRYIIETGAGFQGGTYYLHYAGYILHTGNTWKGSIGRAEVDIDFDSKFLSPAKLIPDEAFNAKVHPENGEFNEKVLNDVMKRNRRTVFWSGPGKPVLSNGHIRFVLTDFQPSEHDDIFLSFGPYKNGGG
ncbi:MAG: hypothetical protein JST12_00880 [Armatimonadetes bacterium]|nr:hypothetical protein [Armatimonadota bacterium]